MRGSLYIAGSIIPSLCLPLLAKMAKRYVICPYYHTVSDTPLPHLHSLYKPRSINEFKADLDWLLAHYKPIKWSDIDYYEQTKQPAFCLTFDDGFKEFYTIVAPILIEKRIPCVCFLNSAFLDNQAMLERCKKALAQKNIDWQQYLRAQQPYMTYKQVKELQEQGLEFGSHSVSHPHYEELNYDEQLAQSLDCDKVLREHQLLPHRLFSFPFGQGHLDTLELVLQTGTHEAVFGTGNMRPAPRNMYNRIWMENTHASARSIVFGEYLREIAHRLLHD